MLPDAHARIYRSQYLANRQGRGGASSLAQRAEAWMHRRVAEDSRGAGAVLELGAGTLNHLPYVQAGVPYDIVEPNAWLHEGSPDGVRVRASFAGIEEVPGGSRYDAIISIATLVHIEDLPRCLARCGLLLAPGGRLAAGIPSEGGALWWLGWRCTTGMSYLLRHGLDYGVLMRHEHLNRCDEIEALARHFFASVQRRRFPLPWRHASLYTALLAQGPVVKRCAEWIARSGRPGAAPSLPA